MISIDEIDKSILELESHDTTYATCEKLAWLYTVKDHLIGTQNKLKANTAGSDFLDACTGKDADAILNIVNEHLYCVKVLYPKEYNAIMEKIKSIP